MMGHLFARLVCRVRGHAWLRYYAPGRVALRCLRCLAETPGVPVAADYPARPRRRAVTRRG